MPPGSGPLDAIEQSALGQAMREALWLYPAVEIVHLVGIVLLVGSIVMLDVRVLGLSRSIPVPALARHLLPWTLAAVLLVLPSGLLLFAAHASDVIANPLFAVKMGLLFAAGVNAAAFHVGPYASVAAWACERPVPPAARLHAAISIALWIAVIAAGRLLAYS
jgi:hypothetical protein